MNMNDNAVREMSSHPRWVTSLYEFVAPHWDNLVNGQWAQSVSSARLMRLLMRPSVSRFPIRNDHSIPWRIKQPPPLYDWPAREPVSLPGAVWIGNLPPQRRHRA